MACLLFSVQILVVEVIVGKLGISIQQQLLEFILPERWISRLFNAAAHLQFSGIFCPNFVVLLYFCAFSLFIGNA